MRSIVLLLALGACASAGTPEDTSSKPTSIFTSPKTGTLIGDAPRPTMTSIAAPPATVWLATKKVFADLEIPVTVENEMTHKVGNTSFYKMRSIGGKPMTEIVNCGSGVDGPKAASYRIYMLLLVSITPDGKGGTTLQTTFAASGQDIMSGAGSDRIQCGSSGILELMINDRVNGYLGRH